LLPSHFYLSNHNPAESFLIFVDILCSKPPIKMAMGRLMSVLLRLAELAFAAIVAGVTGEYLHRTQGVSSWDQGRFIYTEVVAAISILLAIIWLVPFSGSFIHWPVDLLISICWFVAFGLLVNVSYIRLPVTVFH
jgi:hypothetical protein